MDINTLKGDKYNLNHAFTNTTSRFKNEIYNKNNIKHIINEYLTDEYIISNYKQKNYTNIRECIYSSCRKGDYEVFYYVMNKLEYIYNNDMKKAFIDLEVTGYTDLIGIAFLNNCIEIVKYLIGKGADINIQDNKGEVPLHYAYMCKNIEMVKYLIDKGADIHVKDYFGCTPLHYVIEFYGIELLKKLILHVDKIFTFSSQIIM